MPFNPNTSDQRGLMAAQAGSNIASYMFQGASNYGAAMGAGIASAGNSIASGIASLGQQKQVDDKRRANADASSDFLVQQGILSNDQAAKLRTGSLNKYEASVNQGMAEYGIAADLAKENRGEKRALNYLGAQTNATANLATYKTGLDQSTRYTPSKDEEQRMTAAGYAWNATENKWDVDRSKYQSANPLASLLGAPAPAGAAPAASAATAVTPGAAPQVTPAALRDGMTATNPQTGKKMVRQNGQWVNVQ